MEQRKLLREPHSVIGMTAPYDIGHVPKRGTVVSVQTLMNLKGEEITHLMMDNGDKRDARFCYFDFSTESAKI